MMHLLTGAQPGLLNNVVPCGQSTFMQPWTEALLKRLTSGSVHAGVCFKSVQYMNKKTKKEKANRQL